MPHRRNAFSCSGHSRLTASVPADGVGATTIRRQLALKRSENTSKTVGARNRLASRCRRLLRSKPLVSPYPSRMSEPVSVLNLVDSCMIYSILMKAEEACFAIFCKSRPSKLYRKHKAWLTGACPLDCCAATHYDLVRIPEILPLRPLGARLLGAADGWQVEQRHHADAPDSRSSSPSHVRAPARAPFVLLTDAGTTGMQLGASDIHGELTRVERSLSEARLAKIRANVGSVAPHPIAPVAAAALQIVADSRVNSARDVVSDRGGARGAARPPDVLFSPCLPPPPGLTWVRVRTNLRTPEGCDSGYFVPYLGDSDAHLKSSNSLYKDLAENNSDNSDASDSEGGAQDYSDVEEIETAGLPPAGQRLLPFRWDRAVKRVAIRSLVDKFGDADPCCVAKPIAAELNVSEDVVVAYYNNAVRRFRSWDKYDKERNFKADCRRELAAATRAELLDTAETELESDSITMLLCRRCYSFDCMQHGLDTSHPGNDSPDPTQTACMSEADKHAIVERCTQFDPNGCWVTATRNAESPELIDNAVAAAIELPPSAKVLYEAFREQFGDDPCRIAEMLRIVDYTSGAKIRCLDAGAFAKSLVPLRPPKRPRYTGYSAKKSSKSGQVPQKEIDAMESGMRLDYTPCNHPGPCSPKNCSCVKEGVNCEKYCTCNHVRVAGETRFYSDGVCPRSFPGCKCKSSSACQTSNCVCFSFRRECDPDLCRSCGAGNPPGAPRSCCNVGLRLGLRYRTVVGRSRVHGWGVFPVVDIPKNVLVGEYLGEVITQEEAERRGRVYDELQYSFLFNITEKYAIDSTRIGSKLKYCNHLEDPNCEPRLMRVGGDVRVGIYSKKPIQPFEELFFHYGYGKTGPDWAKTVKKKTERDKSKSQPGKDSANTRRATDDEDEDEDEEGDDNEVLMSDVARRSKAASAARATQHARNRQPPRSRSRSKVGTQNMKSAARRTPQLGAADHNLGLDYVEKDDSQ
jgi:SET domain/CXC domain